MLDTLFTVYVLVACVGFVYALRDEAQRTQRRLSEANRSERVNRLLTAFFLALVGYPLAVAVAGGFVGVLGGLLYISGLGILTTLGLV
jgi:hypothetical protein